MGSSDGEIRHYPFLGQAPSPIDPPPLLAVLLEGEPVSRVTMPSGDIGYLVTRYEDARQVLADDSTFSLAATYRPGAPRYTAGALPDVGRSLRTLDGDEHARFRQVVAAAFSPRRVAGLRGMIANRADELMIRMGAKDKPADFVAAVADPLASWVICQLLGVPSADRADFRRWARAIMAAEIGAGDDRAPAFEELANYLARLIAGKRQEPGDDLLSDLATGKPAGGRSTGTTLTDVELVVLALQLLVAGHETTAHHLAICVFVLLRTRERYESLVSGPQDIPGAVEELLRLHPPGAGGADFRVAVKDTEIAGVKINKGSGVVINPAAANRDASVFTEPDEMIYERDGVASHLTFGHGTHFCIGSALARAELCIALAALMRFFPTLVLACEPAQVRWRTSGLAWGPVELPVAW